MRYIRGTNLNDYQRIANVLSMKQIPYLTTELLFHDIINGNCYALISDDNEIKAIGSLIYCPDFQNYAIKRICVLHPEDYGQGYAKEMIGFLLSIYSFNYPIICTPWENNKPMRHILEYFGFKMEYVFQTNWCMYKKQIIKEDK